MIIRVVHESHEQAEEISAALKRWQSEDPRAETLEWVKDAHNFYIFGNNVCIPIASELRMFCNFVEVVRHL